MKTTMDEGDISFLGPHYRYCVFVTWIKSTQLVHINIICLIPTLTLKANPCTYIQ